MPSICITALTGLTNKKKARRGESNLVRREDNCAAQELLIAAVDTGNNKNSEIAEVLSHSQVQTLVLTHDDDDHIRGAKHVLEKSPDAIRELWVPAYWMMQKKILDRLINPGPSSADDSEEIAAALGLGQIAASRDDHCFATSVFEPIFEFSAVVGDRNFDDSAQLRQFGAHGEPLRGEAHRTLFDAHNDGGLEDALDALMGAGINPRQMMIGQPAGKANIGAGWRDLAKRTRSRITAIDEILVAAADRGTLVRCFLPVTDVPCNSASSVSPVWETSGEPGFLTLINAMEVVIRNPKISQVRALFIALTSLVGLSRQNRCALVSFVWPTQADSEDGFIVWSDSSGDWMHLPRFNVPWRHVGGMTAPHHGSDNGEHTKIWKELAATKGTTRIIVSGDLSETTSAVTRADAIHDILTASGAKEYGVVHCLDPTAKNRFPRSEVQYSSFSQGGCLSCYWCLCGPSHHSARSYTEILTSSFAQTCSPGCLGCK